MRPTALAPTEDPLLELRKAGFEWKLRLPTLLKSALNDHLAPSRLEELLAGVLTSIFRATMIGGTWILLLVGWRRTGDVVMPGTRLAGRVRVPGLRSWGRRECQAGHGAARSRMNASCRCRAQGQSRSSRSCQLCGWVRTSLAATAQTR